MKLNRYIIVTERGDLISAYIYNDKHQAEVETREYYDNCFVVDAEICFELPLPTRVVLDMGDAE